jgi:hypothetical protein
MCPRSKWRGNGLNRWKQKNGEKAGCCGLSESQTLVMPSNLRDAPLIGVLKEKKRPEMLRSQVLASRAYDRSLRLGRGAGFVERSSATHITSDVITPSA